MNERRRTERTDDEVVAKNKDPTEPCVLISIHHKQIKAVINTDAQESRLGKNVVTLIEKHEKINPTKKIIKSKYGLVWNWFIRSW